MSLQRPPSPSMPVASRAGRAAPTLSAAQLAALRPHVISVKDGRLAPDGNAPGGASVADVWTTQSEIDAIFAEHLPAFVAEHAPGPVPIVLYAHGGLVDAASGFAIAERQVAWWKRNGVYPIHFVWESGLGTAIWDSLARWASGGRRGWLDEAKDGFVEVAARLLGGGGLWNDMKLDAAAASVEGGGAAQFAIALAAWMTANPAAVTVHAVGHSAGSIFHSHLVPYALDAGVPEFETVSLLAPAVRVDTFRKLLLPRAKNGGVHRLAVFTMDDHAEREDTCMGLYNKSLLYLVARSFEPAKNTPILGMEKWLRRDVEVDAFFAGSKGDLVLAPHAATLRGGSAATSHGDFDNDARTMESVARRVTGKDDVTPFPASASRGAAPWPAYEDVPAAAPRGAGGGSGSAGGARRALCVGVDRYPDAGDELHGAVADAKAWSQTLRAAGFDVTMLTDGEATRESILRGILELVSQAAPGDVLAVQYSGHGTFVPDLDHDEDDDDSAEGGHDEALCPVDFRQGHLIVDDDLARIWDVIPEGVSLTCFFDSCHSGSANRAPMVDLTAAGDSRPRAVQLREQEVAAYRADRGLGAVDGDGNADDLRAAALARVLAAESTPTAAPRAATVRREVLFSACRQTEVAWESNGQGDFTRVALPLLGSATGETSNRDFARAIVATLGPNRRQTPEYHGDEVLGARAVLTASSAALAAASDDDAPKPAPVVVTPEVMAPDAAGPTSTTHSPNGSAHGASDRRAAAVVAVLRATADLLEA